MRMLHLVRRATLVAGSSIGLCLPASAGAQRTADSARAAIPATIREERATIRTELANATKLAGRTGLAARALAALLQPHFDREEQIALPPLALLGPLSRNERVASAAWVVPMTDSLRREMPKMLRDHAAIRLATQRLATAAQSEGQTLVVRFTDKLAEHARAEEELLYPAAIVVGDLVRARGTRP
jgi:hypothetical protein